MNNYRLTTTESRLLEFLEDFKGNEFTADEIEKTAGIPADKVGRIVKNLQWKGHSVCYRRGVYYIPDCSILSYVVGSSIFGTFTAVVSFALLFNF